MSYELGVMSYEFYFTRNDEKLAGTYYIFASQRAHKGLMMSSQRGNEND